MRTIQITVSLVLMLYDAYTGAAADSRTFRVSVREKVSFQKKENGCIVFCDFTGNTLSVRLESPCFRTEELEIALENKNEGPKIQKVWLYPGRKYPLDKDAVVIKGQSEPGQKAVFYPVVKNGYRLMADAEGLTETIHIFHRARECLEGRHILIYPGNQRLVLGEENPGEPGEFHLDKIRLKPAKRGETQICLGYGAETDRNGNYWIAAKGDGQYPCGGILDIEGKMEYIRIQPPSGVIG